MALDPTLSLQAGQGVTPLQQPMDIMGKGLALQSGMLQMQQQRMQNQQIQQQLQDAADLRATLQKAAQEGADPEKAVEKLGSPLAAKYLGTMLDMRQKGVTLQKNQFDLASAHLQKLGNSILGAANTPGATPQAMASLIQQHAQIGDIPGPQAQEMLTDLQNVKTPDDLKSWAQLQAVKSGVAKDVLGLFTPKTTIQGPIAVTQEPLTGKVMGSTPVPGAAASEIGKFAVDLTGKPSITPEVIAKWKELHPNMATMMMATGGTNALSPEAKQMLVDKYIQTGQLDSDLSARMPGLRNEIINTAAAQAKQQGSGTPNLAQAKQQFSSAQAAQKYFTTGKGADAFRQQETILHHAQVFSQIADALNNGNVQLANKLGNQFGAQFGSDQATNYKIAGQIFSAEVGKYLAGGQSTAEERKELSELIPSFSSPSQIKGGLATLSALVQGQRQSWLAQRDAALKGNVAFGGSQTPSAPTTPQVMSLADAKATAAASGKTLDQVIKDAKSRGWRIQ